MPARVPQLDTSGLDVTNAIAKGVAARGGIARAEGQEMSNQLMAEQLTPEAKERRNNIAQMKEKADRLDLESKTYEHAREGLLWTKEKVAAGEIAAFPAWRTHMLKDVGVPPHAIPKMGTFMIEKDDISHPSGRRKEFDKQAFDAWADSTLKATGKVFETGDKKSMTQRTLYHEDGRTMVVGIPKDSEAIDPEVTYGAGWSFKDNEIEDEKADGRTPGQIASGDRAEKKDILAIETRLGKLDKEQNISPELINKGSSDVKMFNDQADKFGLEKYIWHPKAYQSTVENEEKGGLFRLPMMAWNLGERVLFGKKEDEVKFTPGWIKPSMLPKEEATAEAGTEPTEAGLVSQEEAEKFGDLSKEQVEELSIGSYFKYNGNLYKKDKEK